MDDLHINSYLSQSAFFVTASTNERCEVRHTFPTRAQFFPSGNNQLCWTHPGQLRRRVEANHCEPTSTRWPPGYSLPFSSFSLTQRVIMLRRVFTTMRWLMGRKRRPSHKSWHTLLQAAARSRGRWFRLSRLPGPGSVRPPLPAASSSSCPDDLLGALFTLSYFHFCL